MFRKIEQSVIYRKMVQFDDEKYVGSICMLILSVAGVILVWLNSISKQSSSQRDVALTRLLWKFDQGSKEDVFLQEQRMSFLKIVCAGVMLNSVIVALLLKLLDVSLALKWGLLFLIVWILVLVLFWKLYVQNVFSDQKEVQPSSPDFCPTPSEKLRVTIVTGYLGSGKTTLVKRILHNTVGMKVLVIENEIGAEGIDHDLLLQSTDKENIVLLSNGCICCTGTLRF